MRRARNFPENQKYKITNFILFSCNIDILCHFHYVILQLMKLDFDKRYSENITEINRLMESLLQNGLDFVQICDSQKLETDRTYGTFPLTQPELVKFL